MLPRLRGLPEETVRAALRGGEAMAGEAEEERGCEIDVIIYS